MALYDHLQDLKWVWVQFVGKLMPAAAWEIGALGFNLAEEAIDFVRTKLNVIDATGVYLEAIAARYGLSRMGLHDDEFRKVVIVEGASLFGSGDPGLIYRLIRALIGADPKMHVDEFKPHTFVAYVGFNAPVDEVTQSLLGQTLTDVPALTVNGTIVVVENRSLNFSSVDGDVPISAGFSSVDGDVGGAAGYAHAIPL